MSNATTDKIPVSILTSGTPTQPFGIVPADSKPTNFQDLIARFAYNYALRVISPHGRARATVRQAEEHILAMIINQIVQQGEALMMSGKSEEEAMRLVLTSLHRQSNGFLTTRQHMFNPSQKEQIVNEAGCAIYNLFCHLFPLQ